MSKLRQLLRLRSKGSSILTISQLTGIARNTLKKYLNIYSKTGLTVNDIENMSDRELEEIFTQSIPPEPCDKKKLLISLFPQIEKELKRKGATRKKVWENYIRQYPDGYKHSQFKQLYNDWLKTSKPTMHIEHKAGDKMYIDFAGERLKIVDKKTGEITSVEVFIAILGASQMTYIEATMSQKKEDFITCCENSLHYFGGVPMAIVPDNLKSAVVKSDKYEPTLNETFESFAQHYSTAILPARAYKPKDKALVEGAVKIAYQRIYSSLADKTFFTLYELNFAIIKLLDEHNSTHFSGRPYSRKQLFEEIERAALHPLPLFKFEFKKQQIVTVGQNSFVCLREDKHYYTVPFQYIGKKVKILYTKKWVEIYYQYQRIAIHERTKKSFKYSINEEHLPSHHKFVTEWNPTRFINWATSISEPVKELVLKIFEKAQHPEQAYKSCMGILSFEKKVGKDRLSKACKRAIEYQSFNYMTVKKILEKGLEKEVIEENTSEQIIPSHKNIRGEKYYY